MAADNKALGRFILDGIPPAPRGVPQIEVTFDLDASGILNVKAKDKATGREQSIKITGSTGLTKDEVERMTKEAEIHAAEDQTKKERIEARNATDNLIFTAEKTLKEAGEKVSAELKKEVEDKIAALKSILESETKEELEIKNKDLSDSLQKVGQAMYGSTGPAPEGEQTEEGSSQAGPKEPKGEKGDYEEKGKKTEGEVEEGEVVE